MIPSTSASWGEPTSRYIEGGDNSGLCKATLAVSWKPLPSTGAPSLLQELLPGLWVPASAPRFGAGEHRGEGAPANPCLLCSPHTDAPWAEGGPLYPIGAPLSKGLPGAGVQPHAWLGALTPPALNST